ncbi:hypothetical protein [Caldiplasma sukawensis]
MIPAVKAIIAIIIVAGITVPAGYVLYNYESQPSHSIYEFVPSDSKLVVQTQFANATEIIYSNGNNTGIVTSMTKSALLSNFNSTVSLNKNSTASKVQTKNNTFNVTLTKVESYYGFSIYQASGLKVNGLSASGLNLSSLFGTNETIYIGSVFSYLTIGNLSSVKFSIYVYEKGIFLNPSTLPGISNVNMNTISFYTNISALISYGKLTAIPFNASANVSALNGITISSLESDNLRVYGEMNTTLGNVTIISNNMTLESEINGLLNLEMSKNAQFIQKISLVSSVDNSYYFYVTINEPLLFIGNFLNTSINFKN